MAFPVAASLHCTNIYQCFVYPTATTLDHYQISHFTATVIIIITSRATLRGLDTCCGRIVSRLYRISIADRLILLAILRIGGTAFQTMTSPSGQGVLVGQASENSASATASLGVPQDRIVCIEHPCIVKNIDNGVKSLGGEQQLQEVRVLRNGTTFPFLIPL